MVKLIVALKHICFSEQFKVTYKKGSLISMTRAITNTEGIAEFNIPASLNRPNGLSAMVRVRNEELMLKESIESIQGYYDEIVICIQPSDDNTLYEAQQLSLRFDNVVYFEYPFLSLPNGSGYRYQDDNSVFSRTYFYNWCLSKCKYQTVTKWDADMIALPSYARLIEMLRNGAQFIIEYGIDLAFDGQYMTQKKYTGSEIRHFNALKSTFINGDMCEVLGVDSPIGSIFGKILRKQQTRFLNEPTYLHFKWCKPLYLSTQAWPKDWKDNEHFQHLVKRTNNLIERTARFDSDIENTISQICQRMAR
ncbi:hypothetical protein [Brumicola blandensis]|uniref:Uncharacterized protein n=1 Tax=Brumicola blandensis TaxID=3075611 RepID=A0AAW8R4D9_9ALTE|nr:hypothetical protein [Alteromonas sp. W409]MDT0582705.1 hypothetical protein [Alteromonas sp. W409]